MRYRNLGGSGLLVSELVLGSAAFGELVDGPQVQRIVDAAIDQGINTFDTGDSYVRGRAEELLGAALRGHRDRVVIATKVGNRVGDDEAEFVATVRGTLEHSERWRRGISPNDQGLSRAHIVSAVEASLRRLGTDYIDLYQLHRWDPHTPIDETLRALDDLVHSGKVRYIGCSSYAGWQLVDAMWASDRRGLSRLISMQLPYNLLARDVEREALPAAHHLGVGVLAFQGLAGGILTGRYDQHIEPGADTRLGTRESYRARYWNDATFEFVAKLRDLATQCGRRPEELAIGWVLANPSVDAMLIGAERVEEVTANVTAIEHPLSADELTAVAALRP